MLFFRRRKFDFYLLLSQQADKTLEGLQALEAFVRAPSSERGTAVQDLEKQADELRRVLIDALNQSLVTPIDREDIFGLSRAIDDMIDYAKSTVEEIMLFEVEPDEFLLRMAKALNEAGADIVSAVKALKDHPRVCEEHIIRAKKTENLVEHIYREALARLFKTTDVIRILKTRELYRHLSNAADRGDEAADIIGDILVKAQ
ncbi:MAG TPA: DUF47 family protein [Elusimicrobiota bacterium]|jgi:uncharacterized protein Yka (UPF0111/DUF47 family)|nr:DUF47 family protein [Elusimicrobiota bacterium]